MAAVDVVDAYVQSLPGETRRLAHTEWGITLAAESAGGWPCDMSVRIDDGLLRAQAYALPAQEGVDPWVFLQWNRQTRYVRMASTRSGDIWVMGDAPVAGLDERAVDRLLGLMVEGVLAVRGYAAAIAAPQPAEPGGWLSPSN
jgi:hypothetical protein